MKKYCVIDVGGTFIKYGIIDDNGKIIKKDKIPSLNKDLDTFLNMLYGIIDACSEIDGIALSMPGRINFDEGIALTGGAYQFIKDFKIAEIMQKKYNLNVSVANDAHCAAMAELKNGSLKDCESGICIVFGTGLGGAIIINNNVYEGYNFCAGELSAIFTDLNEQVFEGVAAYKVSSRSITAEYEKLSGNDITGEKFFSLVENDDPLAKIVYERFLYLVSSLIFNLQTTLDVNKIALGGGISSVSFLVNDIRERVNNLFDKFNFFPAQKPQIVKCTFENDANLLGAYHYHLKKFSEN